MASPSGAHVLVVEDDPADRMLLEFLLLRNRISCTVARDAEQARERLLDEQFELVLCDANLPGESGLAVARHVRDQHRDTAVVMVSALDDPEVADLALELGAYGYVTKPYSVNALFIQIANALRRRVLETENREYRQDLERKLLERADDLRQAQEESIRRLAWAAERRDAPTGRDLDRMSRYCGFLARKAGLGEQRVYDIRSASLLHDVGKIAVPDEILRKPGPLDERERKIMQTHAEIGHSLLSGSTSGLLELGATIALTHHERVDGSGYPRGASRDDIPIEGRIAAIADVFDALTRERSYRPALSSGQAAGLMRAGRGGQFDNELLDLFLEAVGEAADVSPRPPSLAARARRRDAAAWRDRSAS